MEELDMDMDKDMVMDKDMDMVWIICMYYYFFRFYDGFIGDWWFFFVSYLFDFYIKFVIKSKVIIG